MLHLVPAQVHVNGHGNSMDRETDILDDDLPISQEGNSVDSLGTLSSFEGRATPADLYYQPETVINGQDGPYMEKSPQQQQQQLQQQEQRVQEPMTLVRSSSSAQERLADSGPPSSGYASQNGSIYRSQSFGSEPAAPQQRGTLPKAPARTTSSREAVQRGLNVWQQYGVPEAPLTDGVHFSPALHSHSLPEFPRAAASQHEIEQSIEALNMLMLDLDPAMTVQTEQQQQQQPAVPKSYSAPSGAGDASGVVTTQPSFSQSQARPSYQADMGVVLGSHPRATTPQAHISPAQTPGRPAEAQVGPAQQRPTAMYQPGPGGFPAFPTDAEAIGLHRISPAPQTQSSGPSPTFGQLQLKPINTYPPSAPSYSPDSQVVSSMYPASTPNSQSASSSPLPKESQPEEPNYNLEGLVAHRVAGKGMSHISALSDCLCRINTC